MMVSRCTVFYETDCFPTDINDDIFPASKTNRCIWFLFPQDKFHSNV